jgi:hypothetical protein
MTHRIERDQVYYSLDPREEMYGNGVRRIKIVGRPGTLPGGQHFGKVEVATLTDDGREIRRRLININQLHASPTKDDGTPRVTGYALES